MKMRRTATWQAIMEFCYIYILKSENDPERFYSGLADDMENRRKIHNLFKLTRGKGYQLWQSLLAW